MADCPDSDSALLFDGAARLRLDIVDEPRGRLIPLDFDALPFEPAGMFLVTGVPANETRGGHGHERVRQLLFCPVGRIDLRLICGGREWHVTLDAPDQAILIEPGVWSEQRYADPGTVLCVVSDGPFDPAERFDVPR